MTTYFDKHAAALLNAAGYTCERHPATWHDDGDAENGPHLTGYPDFQVWFRDNDNGTEHEFIVCNGLVEEEMTMPTGPEECPPWTPSNTASCAC